MATSNASHAVNRRSMEQRRLRLYVLCLIFDLAAIIAGFVLAGQIRGARGLMINGFPLVAGAVPLYIAFAIAREAYSVECLRNYSESVRRVLAALGAMAIIIVAFAFFAQVGAILSRLAFAYAILISGMFMLLGRAAISATVHWGFRGAVVRNLLIVDGSPAEAPEECDVLDIEDVGMRPDLADPDRVARLSVLVEPYDKVYLSVSPEQREAWITALKATGISVELVVSMQEIHGAVGLDRLGNSDTLILSRGPLSLSSQVKKRVFDLVLTVPVLILITPLLIAVAIAIKLDSPGPALFPQTRIGRGNRPFKIYKFRSMYTAQADAHGVRSTSRGDARITRVGKFIRATSIDELPQLLNVVIGNMSLVGPRPHARSSTAGERLFWEVSHHYWLRHAAKPGITGLAQIRGYRGATEKPEDLEARLRSDLEYLQNWNFWTDLMILFATVRVIRHDNAF